MNSHEILSVSGSENKVCVEGKHGTHNYTVENNTIKAIYPYVGFRISKTGRFLTFLSIPKKVSNYAEYNKILWQINQLHNSQLSSTQLDYDKPAKGTKTGKNLTLLFCAVALISAIGFISSFTGNTKAIVTDAAPEAYPDITIGQTFENFFDDPTWDYYQSNGF